MSRPLHLSATQAASSNGDAIPVLRRFHLTGRGAPSALPGDLVPALLHELRDPSHVRDGYPLFVASPGVEDVPAVATVTDLLRDACARAFADSDGKVVVDNLDRLELAIRRDVSGKDRPADVAEMLSVSGTAMLAGLGLREAAASDAQHAFDRLLDHAPAGAFVPCSARTPLHLFALAQAQASTGRYRAALSELAAVRDRLVVSLDVDRGKSAAGRSSEILGRSLGSVTDRLLEPEAVASLLGRVRGAVPMAAERRARMEGALATIRRFLETHVEKRTTLVVPAGSDRIADDEDFHVVSAEDPLAAAHDRALESAAAVLGLCRAVRLARLELDGRYDSARHDEWLAALGSEALEEDERALIPPVVVWVRTADVEARWVQSLSRVLRSPWPVVVISVTTPLRPIGPDPGMDIGYFGVGHRSAFVQQVSLSRPVHLYEGLAQALGASRPSLHVVDTGETSTGDVPVVGRWLRAGAAIEARAHPLFRFDPEAGADWASRFDLDENPAPDAAWSTGEVTAARETGDPATITTAFTVADLALLDPALGAELAPAPVAESDALVTVDRYLEMTAEERAGHVPYVWAADATGALHRVAVTERLCRASAERRDFWHTLQELAGIRSTYVDRAEARVRESVEADAAERLERAGAEHAEALQRARDEAASEAFDGLARFLLNMDDALLPSPGAGTAARAPAAPASAPAAETAPAAPAEAPAEEAPVEAEAEAEEGGFEDPWIETVLCTSCNDCTNINPKLFIYDGNKQAHIGDPDAGSFEELVRAAEKCPARCIHPGKPRNPSEPNLEELVRRAAPFNT